MGASLPRHPASEAFSQSFLFPVNTADADEDSELSGSEEQSGRLGFSSANIFLDEVHSLLTYGEDAELETCLSPVVG